MGIHGVGLNKECMDGNLSLDCNFLSSTGNLWNSSK